VKLLNTVEIGLKNVLLGGLIFMLIHSILLIPSNSFAQQQEEIDEKLQEKAIKVFLDMLGRFDDHIKREIPYVNYVRDRKQAQVYIMQTSQSTGAGGNEYTVALMGQQNFNNVNDTLFYVSKRSDSNEMTREGIVKILKRGLMR